MVSLDESKASTSSTPSRSSLDLSQVVVEKDVHADLGKSRFVILAIVLICSVWSTGLIFGWAPLYGLLIRAGVYSDLCLPASSPASIAPSTEAFPSMAIPSAPSAPQDQESPLSQAESPLCETQQKRLNLIYTAGSALTQASLFVSGIILDWKGPKITATLSTLITSLGALLFGFSAAFKVDLFIVGFALMGFGGAGINLATYTVSNLFPNHKSWVVSSLVGVWTLSSLWFLIFRPTFNAGISLHALFFAQAVLLLTTAVVFFFTFPSRALRDGERFSFLQWLPWNAESRKLHQLVSSASDPGDIMLQPMRDSQDDGMESATPRKEEFPSGAGFSAFSSQAAAVASPLPRYATTTVYPVPMPSAGADAEVFAHLDLAVHDASQFDISGRTSLERSTANGSPLTADSASPQPGEGDLAPLDLGRAEHYRRISSNNSMPLTETSTPSSQDSSAPLVGGGEIGGGGEGGDSSRGERRLSHDSDDSQISRDSSATEISNSAAFSLGAKGSFGAGLAMAKAVLIDVLTVDFGLLALWFAVHVLFFEFYIGTIADALDFRTRQKDYPLGPAIPGAAPQTKTIDTYVLTFNMLYAVGFIFVPVYAWTTDHLGFVGSFFLATLFAFAYPLVAMAPWLPSQFFAYVIYSAAIQFVYSCQFGYVAYRFGYQHFGVLVGVMGVLTACLIPLQPVFLRLVLHKFGGNFFWMYLIQACVALPLFATVIWNWYSSRKIKNSNMDKKKNDSKESGIDLQIFPTPPHSTLSTPEPVA